MRLNQFVHPAFLTLLKGLDHLSLVQQVFLILAEVLSAYVFDFLQLFVIFVLHLLTMSRRGSINTPNVVLQVVNLLEELFLEDLVGHVDLLFHIALVTLQHLVNLFDLFDSPLMIKLSLLVELLVGKVDLVEELILGFVHLRTQPTDCILARRQHGFVLCNVLLVGNDHFFHCVDLLLHITHDCLVLRFRSPPFVSKFSDTFIGLLIHSVCFKFILLSNFVEVNCRFVHIYDFFLANTHTLSQSGRVKERKSDVTDLLQCKHTRLLESIFFQIVLVTVVLDLILVE